MYFAVYLVIAIASLVAYLLHRNMNYWKNRGIPYDKPHPFFGNLRGFRTTTNIHSIHYDYYKKYRKSGLPFVGFYLLQKPSAYIMDRNLIKNILIKDFSNFVDRGVFHNEKDDPLTQHLFALDGKRWKQLRNKLSPTFTSGKMKFMFPTIVKVAEELINVMQREVPSTADGCVLEIKELMACFTTDVIGTCAFGIECNTLHNAKSEFRRMGIKSFTEQRHGPFITAFLMSFPKLAKKLRMRMIPEDVHNFFMGLVKDTVAYREKEKIRRNDFMDMVIELKNKGSVTLESGEVFKGMDIEELAAQVFVFYLAGFETSSSTMSYALYELAKHQDLQDKLREDIGRAMEKHDNKLTYECISDMQYLDQVIAETLRLYTIVPHLERVAEKDYVVPDHPHLKIESGTRVIIPACAIHRDPEVYPKPNEFDPDRFSPEQVASRESVDWLPFGDGPRNCIGLRFGKMQSRIGMTLLLTKFKFSVCDKTEKNLTFSPKSFTLGTEDGIHLRVERIN